MPTQILKTVVCAHSKRVVRNSAVQQHACVLYGNMRVHCTVYLPSGSNRPLPQVKIGFATKHAMEDGTEVSISATLQGEKTECEAAVPGTEIGLVHERE